MSKGKYRLTHEHCDICGKDVIQSIYSCKHSQLYVYGYFRNVNGKPKYFMSEGGIKKAKGLGMDISDLRDDGK